MRTGVASAARSVAAMCVMALVLTSGVACGRKAPPEPPAWENVLAMIGPDGEISLDMALKAFAVTYGPMPGVETPQGAPDVRSGTLAASWVLNHWSDLNTEQRQRVKELLRLPDELRVAPAAFRPTGVTRRPAPAKPIGCTGTDRATPIPVQPFENADVAKMVKEMVVEIEAKLATTFFPDMRIVLCKSSQDLPSRALADSTLWFHKDGNRDCRITFFKTYLNKVGPSKVKGEPSKAVVVHELTHCYMRHMVGQAPGLPWARDIPAWVDQGFATFAEVHVTNDASEADGFWRPYLLNPGDKLNRRESTAMGFFWHIENTRHDMWHTIEAVVKAPKSAAAFEAAVAKDRARVMNNLPSGWLRDPTRGKGSGLGPWDMGGVGITGHKFTAPIGGVTSGTQETVSSGPWANALKTVSLRTEVLMFDVSASAFGRFGPGPDGDFTLADAASRLFCVKPGGCACPDGTKPPVQFTNIPAGNSHVAVTGGTAVAKVVMSGQKLADYCKDPKKPKGQPKPPSTSGSGGGAETPKPAGGCARAVAGGQGGRSVLRAEGASCAVSNGDPHLITFDGVHYDMQAVGEFIMTRSTVDSFEIQARTAAISGSKDVSVNSAVAVNVDGDRAAAYLDPAGVTVRVNGVPVPLSEGDTPLPKGGQLSQRGTLIGFTWADGTQAWLTPIGSWGFKLEISLAGARNGRVTGLLGNAGRDAGPDLSTRDGRKLPNNPTFADLYPAFADSWRVSQAESLFDYEPQQNTNTFTDRSLPQKDINPALVPNRAAAEATCRAAGITDPKLLEDCIVDVAISGATEFATATASLQQFLAPSAAATGVAPGGLLRSGDTASGRITKPYESQKFQIDLGSATRFWIAWTGPTTGCDKAFSVTVAGASTGTFPCTGQAQAFDLPTPGQYMIEIWSWQGGTGPYSFRITTQP